MMPTCGARRYGQQGDAEDVVPVSPPAMSPARGRVPPGRRAGSR